MSGFDAIFDETSKLAKDNLISKEEFTSACKRVNRLKKELIGKYKAVKNTYLEKENKAYNEKLEAAYKSLNASSKDSYDELIADTSIDDKFRNKKYKYRLSVAKKQFNQQRSKLDLEHQMNLAAIKHDLNAIKNVAHNTNLHLATLRPTLLFTKVKNFFLTLIFGQLVNQNKMNRHARSVLANIGVYNIMPQLPMGMYDIQSRKLIEIAKILNKNPDIFIVDETTTALSEDGRQILYKKINDL